MKIITLNLFILALSISVFGQEKKDTISSFKANKWNASVGVAFSLGTSKRVCNFDLPAEQTLTEYSSHYRIISTQLGTLFISPEASFFLILNKNKVLFKNEFALTGFHTHESYKITGQQSTYPNNYTFRMDDYDRKYTSLTYKLMAGLKIYRFQILLGGQVLYILSAKQYIDGYNGLINQLVTFSGRVNLENKLFWGPSLEVNFCFLPKWCVGIKAFRQINISVELPHKYRTFYISNIQFSIARTFCLKNKTK